MGPVWPFHDAPLRHARGAGGKGPEVGGVTDFGEATGATERSAPRCRCRM